MELEIEIDVIELKKSAADEWLFSARGDGDSAFYLGATMGEKCWSYEWAIGDIQDPDNKRDTWVFYVRPEHYEALHKYFGGRAIPSHWYRKPHWYRKSECRHADMFKAMEAMFETGPWA